MNLLHTQSWHTVVGGCPATATCHGGETPVRPCAAQKPYRARLSKQSGAVMRWEYVGAMAVAKELRKRKARPSGWQWHWRRCAMGRAKPEEVRESDGARGTDRAEPCMVALCMRQHTMAWVRRWPAAAMRWPSPGAGRPLRHDARWPSESMIRSDGVT